MSRPCRYLIMAGGTGGHIFPAMAVAEALIERGADVQWLGTARGMEHQLVPKTRIPLRLMTVKGFRGKRLWDKLVSLLRLLQSVGQSITVIRQFDPQVVVGFGGYVAAPGGIAAKLMGRKLIIHEQNSVAGSTNKFLAKIACKVLEAFPGSLPGASLVGNPVRGGVKQLYHPVADTSAQQEPVDTADKKINLLILGGSLGALAINRILPEVINALPARQRPVIWHQTGEGKLEEVSAAYGALGIKATCEAFISGIEVAYQWADLVICRAGALTVSELAVAGLPAIFIPYPHAIDNHQWTNAHWLVKNQGAVMLEQSRLTVARLREPLLQLINQREQLRTMANNLTRLALPEATEQVVAVCEQLCRGGSDHATGK